jgi:hypothetical protein
MALKSEAQLLNDEPNVKVVRRYCRESTKPLITFGNQGDGEDDDSSPINQQSCDDFFKEVDECDDTSLACLSDISIVRLNNSEM